MSGIQDEIKKALSLSRKMVGEYLNWYDKISFGSTHNTVYSDIIDFVNFRIETANSCLGLIENEKISDSLGLSRSLLENYLLLTLMCRGTKYFRLQSLEDKTPEEFTRYLIEQQADLVERKKSSSAGALYVAKYPRGKRHLMYVFEGFSGNDDEGFVIPAHFFHFREFHPETMRLKGADYFEYYNPGPEARRVQKDQRANAEALYRFYLSYDALLQCLELNEIADDNVIARIEAHYTFLGKFLHPTHNAARLLHEKANYYTGRPAIGMDQEYTKDSILLSALYVAYLLAGILDEVASFFESAPPKYVTDAGTTDLRELTSSVRASFSYFWFLFNGAPLWDKFNHAIHHLNDEELAEYGGYEGVPDSAIAFDWDIYRHLSSAIAAWTNGRVGRYPSPLEG